MRENDAAQAFVAHMLEYTIRVVRLGPGGQPGAVASGFIIPVGQWYRIISVGHAIGASPDWLVETVPVSATETLMLRVADVRTLTSIATEGASASLDVAWADLDPESLRAQFAQATKVPSTPVELPLYTGPIALVPEASEIYGFAAWNRVELHPTIHTLRREASYELYMKYAGSDPTTGLYRFALGRLHQGRDYYEGASGAPIADSEGRIVSLVVCGDPTTNHIYGFPLAIHAATLRNAA